MWTDAEANEFLKDVTLEFGSYYKYVFTYEAKKGEFYILCRCGGNSDDIYRLTLTRKEKFGAVDWWDSVVVTDASYKSVYLGGGDDE